mmetsp:Transcript_45068/g.130129  ORF Transcript_45068/g.130129 Transcript_45068/m.130129 type:complete len:166 (+) Transcript_45068:3-500(+)
MTYEEPSPNQRVSIASEEALEREVVQALAQKFGMTYEELMRVLEEQQGKTLDTKLALSEQPGLGYNVSANAERSDAVEEEKPADMSQETSVKSSPLTLTAVMLKHQMGRIKNRAPTLRSLSSRRRIDSGGGGGFLLFDMNVDALTRRRSSAAPQGQRFSVFRRRE